MAFSRGELAAPIDQRRLPIVHRILERRVTTNSTGFGRSVGGRRNQLGAGGPSTVCDQAPAGARTASTTRNSMRRSFTPSSGCSGSGP